MFVTSIIVRDQLAIVTSVRACVRAYELCRPGCARLRRMACSASPAHAAHHVHAAQVSNRSTPIACPRTCAYHEGGAGSVHDSVAQVVKHTTPAFHSDDRFTVAFTQAALHRARASASPHAGTLAARLESEEVGDRILDYHGSVSHPGPSMRQSCLCRLTWRTVATQTRFNY